MDRTGFGGRDMSLLYSSMSDYWSVLLDLGDGIFHCQDLEELKIRKEIATKCDKLVTQFDLELNVEYQKIINEAKEELKSKDQSENINNDTIERLKQEHDKILNKVVEEFEKETKLMGYQSGIISSYRVRIEESFKRIQTVFLSIWKTHWTIAYETNEIDKMKLELINTVSNFIKQGESLDTFDQLVEEKIRKCDQEYSKHLQHIYATENQLINQIQDSYNALEIAFNESFPNFQVSSFFPRSPY